MSTEIKIKERSSNMKKFDAEKIVIDWFIKCNDGYAQYPFSEPEVENLKTTLIEHGVLDMQSIIARIRNKINYTETSTPITTFSSSRIDSTSADDISDLHYVFNAVKDDYARYLSIMYYFDSNSLGTLSEVLLSELIKTIPDVSVSHTGGSQCLSDIKINGKDISLKTTEQGKLINLGSHEFFISKGDNSVIIKEMTNFFTEKKIDRLLVSELKASKEISSNCIDLILRRLAAVNEKIVGRDEHFVWIEKIYSNGKVLGKINIHILKVCSEKLENLFDRCEIYLTQKGWGLYFEDIQLIGSDTVGKFLNIHPNFIKNSLTDDEIISIKIPIDIGCNKDEIREDVVTLFMDSLKDISEKIYGK